MKSRKLQMGAFLSSMFRKIVLTLKAVSAHSMQPLLPLILISLYSGPPEYLLGLFFPPSVKESCYSTFLNALVENHSCQWDCTLYKLTHLMGCLDTSVSFLLLSVARWDWTKSLHHGVESLWLINKTARRGHYSHFPKVPDMYSSAHWSFLDRIHFALSRRNQYWLQNWRIKWQRVGKEVIEMNKKCMHRVLIMIRPTPYDSSHWLWFEMGQMDLVCFITSTVKL